MTVYSKTNAGRLLAFEQKPSISQALKDMLRRVDGKTARYQLTIYAGDDELFEELCARQLVQVTTEPWRHSSAQSAADCPPMSLVANPESLQRSSKIDAVKELMRSFVKMQLPEHTEAILAEINSLTSEAQLLCMLSGYVHFVGPAGAAGQTHVQDLLLALAGDP